MAVNTIVIQMGTTLTEAERLIIEATLQRTGWNMSLCARLLGIDYESLYAKLRAHRVAEQSRDATMPSHVPLRRPTAAVSIRRLLVLVIFICVVHGQRPYFVKNALNGLAWRNLSPSDKTLYLTGATEALYVAHESLLAQANLECVRSIVNVSSTWFKGSLQVLRRDMDEFYENAENVPIPVMNALVLSQMKFAGTPKIESDQYRAGALKAATN